MGFPAFVNFSNDFSANGVTSITAVNLPGGRSNGNVLIAEVLVKAAGKTLATATAGWTIGDSSGTGLSGCWAWRIVDGTETVPTFTWSGAADAQIVVEAFSGNATPTPIGAIAKTVGTGTSATSSAIVSTADNSIVHDILITDVGGDITTPRIGIAFDRVLLGTQPSVGASAYDYGLINKSGETTDTVTYPIQSSNWILFSIEVLGTGVGVDTKEQVSQASQQTVESYSTPIMPSLASQIVQTDMESYSTPLLYSIASQICITVLRTVEVTTPKPEAQVQIYD